MQILPALDRFIFKGHGRQAGSSAKAQRDGSHHLRDQKAKDKLVRREAHITLTAGKYEAG